MLRRRMQQPSKEKGWHVIISSSTTDSYMMWRWSWFLYNVPLRGYFQAGTCPIGGCDEYVLDTMDKRRSRLDPLWKRYPGQCQALCMCPISLSACDHMLITTAQPVAAIGLCILRSGKIYSKSVAGRRSDCEAFERLYGIYPQKALNIPGKSLPCIQCKATVQS